MNRGREESRMQQKKIIVGSNVQYIIMRTSCPVVTVRHFPSQRLLLLANHFKPVLFNIRVNLKLHQKDKGGFPWDFMTLLFMI